MDGNATERGYAIMPDELKELRDEMKQVSAAVNELKGAIGVIQTYIQTEAARCPYREAIAHATALEKRVAEVEVRLLAVQLKVAGIAAGAGFVSSVITAVIINAIK